jgi:hypothetical protein
LLLGRQGLERGVVVQVIQQALDRPLDQVFVLDLHDHSMTGAPGGRQPPLVPSERSLSPGLPQLTYIEAPLACVSSRPVASLVELVTGSGSS